MSETEQSAGLKRHKTWIDRELNREFQAQVQRRGRVGSHVVYDRVRDAAIAAEAGISLPPGRERTNLPPMPADPVEINWPQGAEEYRQWKAAINAAGSSLRAVITAGVRAYTEDERLVLPPSWTAFPPHSNSKNKD